MTITGTPTFLTDINDYLQGGMLTLGGIAVAVMTVILVVTFGVRWRLLPLLAMVVGIVWGFGAFGFTGTKLSLVTIAGLPILIGLGIEFAIQIQNRIEEERALDRGRSIRSARRWRATGPPMVVATVAAVIAFLTMRISQVPMVQDFGVLLSIGIIALLVAGIVLPTTIIGARERRWPTTKPPSVGWVERIVQALGSLPRAALVPLVVAARRAARRRPRGRGRHAHRERPDQLGRPVEPDDQERPAARGRDGTGDHARHLHRDRDGRRRRRLHRPDGRVRRRPRRPGPRPTTRRSSGRRACRRPSAG